MVHFIRNQLFKLTTCGMIAKCLVNLTFLTQSSQICSHRIPSKTYQLSCAVLFGWMRWKGVSSTSMYVASGAGCGSHSWTMEPRERGWGLGVPLRVPQGLSQATHHQHQHSRACVCVWVRNAMSIRLIRLFEAWRWLWCMLRHPSHPSHPFSCHRSHYATIIPRRVNVITGNALVKLIPHYWLIFHFRGTELCLFWMFLQKFQIIICLSMLSCWRRSRVFFCALFFQRRGE